MDALCSAWRWTTEDGLRRRHRAEPDRVWEEVAAMGPLYRRGERFPYWPAWLDDGEAGSGPDS